MRRKGVRLATLRAEPQQAHDDECAYEARGGRKDDAHDLGLRTRAREGRAEGCDALRAQMDGLRYAATRAAEETADGWSKRPTSRTCETW